MTVEVVPLNGIKVHVFFEKRIEKKHLCYHEKNYCYFWKSNFPIINLVVGSRNMIKLSKMAKVVLANERQSFIARLNGEQIKKIFDLAT